jgi:hypothetical protein
VGACSAPPIGLVSGRALDLDQPVLIMVVEDSELEGGAHVERSGFAVAVAVRQALSSHGAKVYTGTSRTLDAALGEAEELACSTIAQATITVWEDFDRDWIANPDRLGVTLRLVSVKDGLTIGYGDKLVELANLQAARQSPLQLAPDLAQDLVDELLEGRIEPSDVPDGD